MKKKLTVALALFLVVASLATVALGCGGSKDPWENKTFLAIRRSGPVDPRIDYFHGIQMNADSTVILTAEEGITAIYFHPTPDATNKKLVCTITGIYVDSVTTPSHSLYGTIGHISDLAIVRECIGEQTTFTLYVNSENVITSDDFPTLLPDVQVGWPA